MIWHPEYLAALALGFFGSLHCLGMCGPIALIVPGLGKGTGGRIAGGLVYNGGRIFTYTLLGLVMALFGSALWMFQWQQTISILLGITIVLSAILPRIFRRFNMTGDAFRISNQIKTTIGKRLKKGSVGNLFTIGMANGLLPCGLVYLGLAGSLALGELWHGALFMTFFGLGTIPMMTGVHLIGHTSPAFKIKLVRILPVVTVLFGTLLILRGLGLGIPYLSPTHNSSHSIGVGCIIAE